MTDSKPEPLNVGAIYEQIRRRMADPMYVQIRQKVEAVVRGKITPDRITGSTTVRLAVGLILDDLPATNPDLPDDPAAARSCLDEIQTAAVRDLRPIFSPLWHELRINTGHRPARAL